MKNIDQIRICTVLSETCANGNPMSTLTQYDVTVTDTETGEDITSVVGDDIFVQSGTGELTIEVEPTTSDITLNKITFTATNVKKITAFATQV